MSSAVSSYESLKPYYRNPRVDVLPYVPDGVSMALDVGCGAGGFGSMLQMKTGAEVWGIEPEQEPAAFAAQRLARVFVGTAEEHMDHLPKGTFDLVTFTDVLEHTVQPDEVLRLTRPLLKPTGCVLVSLPNVRHWPSFLRLAWDGDFPQEDSGIFDRTHLRFFTRLSIPRLFESTGYRVERLEGINPVEARTLEWANRLTRGRFEDCRFLQYVVLARPA